LKASHFTVKEFGLPPLGRKLRDGFEPVQYPPKWIDERLGLLCAALEVLREELGGRVVHILSGYRPENYNRAIGGARKSQHVEGRAADVVVDGVETSVVHDTALRLAKAGRMRIGGLGRYGSFTHVDVRNVHPAGPNPRLVRWVGGRVDS
jgi:uncharacterized protein YcbK (DUF882 family)